METFLARFMSAFGLATRSIGVVGAAALALALAIGASGGLTFFASLTLAPRFDALENIEPASIPHERQFLNLSKPSKTGGAGRLRFSSDEMDNCARQQSSRSRTARQSRPAQQESDFLITTEDRSE